MQRDRFKQLKRLDKRLEKGAYSVETERYSVNRYASRQQSSPLRVSGAPQLERLKQPRRSLTRAGVQRQTGHNRITSSARRRSVSLATEEAAPQGRAPYNKSLPRWPDSSRVSNAHVPLLEKPDRASPPRSRYLISTALRASARVVAPDAEPEIVMSEEEQRRLQALEMRLPRVAGKIDSLLLAVILTVLCTGLVILWQLIPTMMRHTSFRSSCLELCLVSLRCLSRCVLTTVNGDASR